MQYCHFFFFFFFFLHPLFTRISCFPDERDASSCFLSVVKINILWIHIPVWRRARQEVGVPREAVGNSGSISSKARLRGCISTRSSGSWSRTQTSRRLSRRLVWIIIKSIPCFTSCYAEKPLINIYYLFFVHFKINIRYFNENAYCIIIIIF